MTDRQDRDQLQAALDVAQSRITELEAERDEHAALDAETDAGLEQIELERDDAIQRADAAEARERAKDEALQTCRDHAWEGCNAPNAAYRWCERIDEVAHAALAQQPADQPAQDGGREYGATPENVNDYLDGHDNGLNVGYSKGWHDALERAAQVAENTALLPMMRSKKLAAAIRNLRDGGDT